MLGYFTKMACEIQQKVNKGGFEKLNEVNMAFFGYMADTVNTAQYYAMGGLAASRMTPNATQRPGSLNISNSQLGKKWGKHKMDYPDLKNHTEYQNLANDIFKNHDKAIFNHTFNEFHYMRGNDLLRVKPNGEFISLYPGAGG